MSPLYVLVYCDQGLEETLVAIEEDKFLEFESILAIDSTLLPF